jgi:hypothetical protein
VCQWLVCQERFKAVSESVSQEIESDGEIEREREMMMKRWMDDGINNALGER